MPRKKLYGLKHFSFESTSSGFARFNDPNDPTGEKGLVARIKKVSLIGKTLTIKFEETPEENLRYEKCVSNGQAVVGMKVSLK
jgi:hypothetical protein